MLVCLIAHCLFFSLEQPLPLFLFFFFNDTATTEIYTLSLHDALPIYRRSRPASCWSSSRCPCAHNPRDMQARSEEHTSELQSRLHLVCRLLLEKKKILQLITISLIHTPVPPPSSYVTYATVPLTSSHA